MKMEKTERKNLTTKEEKRIAGLRTELYEYCDKTETSRNEIEYIVNYYIHSLKWSEEDVLMYVIGTFLNGSIRQIKEEFNNQKGAKKWIEQEKTT